MATNISCFRRDVAPTVSSRHASTSAFTSSSDSCASASFATSCAAASDARFQTLKCYIPVRRLPTLQYTVKSHCASAKCRDYIVAHRSAAATAPQRRPARRPHPRRPAPVRLQSACGVQHLSLGKAQGEPSCATPVWHTSSWLEHIRRPLLCSRVAHAQNRAAPDMKAYPHLSCRTDSRQSSKAWRTASSCLSAWLCSLTMAASLMPASWVSTPMGMAGMYLGQGLLCLLTAVLVCAQMAFVPLLTWTFQVQRSDASMD